MDQLNEARNTINEIDRQMAELFERRMDAASAIAAYKAAHGLPILDQAREEALIKRNTAYILDPDLRPYYVNFLKGCMSASRAYQECLTSGLCVAFCGCEGAFGHIAAGKLYPGARRISYPDFPAAYRAVEMGECDIAVLPLENSSNGEVGQVTDLLFSGSLYVNRITELAVTQDLLVLPGTKREQLKGVISHPQALGQCAAYIHAHGWTETEYSNTALAAKYVAEKQDPSLCAIASAEAAEVFGLEVLERNINESRTNTTRFAALSRGEYSRTEGGMGTHSILLFTVRNEAGSLARAIDTVGHYGFNMRTLRSRPMKELLWQYYFYIEIEGSIHTETGRAMLKALAPICDRLKVVGTYTGEQA